MILVIVQRFSIQEGLRSEGRVKTLCRNPHRFGEVSDRGPFVAMIPKSSRSCLKHHVSVESRWTTRSGAPTWFIYHSGHCCNTSPFMVFRNGHCDYTGVSMIHQFGHHAESSKPARRLDAVIDRAIAENRIVGTVVLVAEDGRCVYERTAGWADRTRRTPIALNTIFRLASVTKPILTAAAMRLTETGH